MLCVLEHKPKRQPICLAEFRNLDVVCTDDYYDNHHYNNNDNHYHDNHDNDNYNNNDDDYSHNSNRQYNYDNHDHVHYYDHNHDDNDHHDDNNNHYDYHHDLYHVVNRATERDSDAFCAMYVTCFTFYLTS